ncbi:MAG: TetR/AcrR family transcriptional regulator [Microbacteriaceae bacterium]|nr:TetR/AcrR family transcriptional regulator [Microbacteriaceae bacterium]MCL2794522.1 TetR/AcrR family transcriptional regulator [Microbacteriaceae bacterium]
MDAAADDPRAVRSRLALIAAGTELLDAHEFDELSITQVVAAAGVTRPTFYQHFGDLSELARAAVAARLTAEFTRHDPAQAASAETQADWQERVEPIARELLEHLAAHRDFYRRVLRGPRSGSAVDAVVEIVATRILDNSPLLAGLDDSSSDEVRDSVAIVSGGLVWLLGAWLRTSLTGRDSVPAMAHRVAVQVVRLARGPGRP